MTSVINLYTIDMILSSADVSLPPGCQMLYINCLIHHFRDKEATEVNAVQFELFKNDIPNYNKHQKMFEKLHKAGLINITSDRITFLNKWGSHIDKTKLDKPKDDYSGSGNFHKPEKFKSTLLENRLLQEHLEMRKKLKKEKYIELVNEFISEQMAVERKYINAQDCTKHFSNWIKYQVGESQGNKVVSNSKLLGGTDGK